MMKQKRTNFQFIFINGVVNEEFALGLIGNNKLEIFEVAVSGKMSPTPLPALTPSLMGPIYH